jgi:membrane-associated phospholipid phosphatase
MASLAGTGERAQLASFGRASFNVLAAPALVLLFVGLFALRPATPPLAYAGFVGLMAFAAWRWLPRTDFRTFCLYILAFSLFNGLRTVADETGNPWQYTYAIVADEVLFLGSVPTVWLQDRLYQAGQVSTLEWACIATYVSYFSAHFVLGAIIWAKKRELLGTYVSVVVVTLCIGLSLYFLLPTAPPWLAANAGDLPDVARISALANSEMWANAYDRGAYVAGANDVGAMPSLHTALTAVVAMACWRMNRLVGVIGWLYVGTMGFSLIYLGEHYLIDILAGVATAAVAWRLVTSRARLAIDN